MKRLSKALAGAGVASRRAAEKLIFEGRVTVNGKTTFIPQTMVDWEKDEIRVDGSTVKGEEGRVYYILNKPKGYICSNARIGSKKLVIDLFDTSRERLFTVGRLDRDTTGLILVTNDGHFTQKVIHPSKGLEKEYLIKVHQEVGHDHLVSISKGVYIDGSRVKPVKVVKVRKGTLKIVVMEGKKREVRLMVQSAGLDIESLSRIRIGGLNLGSLEIGMHRKLTEKDMQNLFAKPSPLKKKEI